METPTPKTNPTSNVLDSAFAEGVQGVEKFDYTAAAERWLECLIEAAQSNPIEFARGGVSRPPWTALEGVAFDDSLFPRVIEMMNVVLEQRGFKGFIARRSGTCIRLFKGTPAKEQAKEQAKDSKLDYASAILGIPRDQF